ncbi:MAG: dihydrodipicolinate reductase [Marinibacterium sp.]|nr:dihydrodipicolinate reductase [Marinibacterium sp.]
MLRLLLAVGLMASASPVWADFDRITDASQFRDIVSGKSLTRPLIRLQVSPGGEITGTGATRPVSGSWKWQNGYFCRDLAWGKKQLGYNCQEVRVNGRKIRFTSDKGAGDFADFTIR